MERNPYDVLTVPKSVLKAHSNLELVGCAVHFDFTSGYLILRVQLPAEMPKDLSMLCMSAAF